MKAGRVEALICRAPEFYGPGLTQNITNTTVIEPLIADKMAKALGTKPEYTVVKRWQLVQPGCAVGHAFDSSKFKQRFPEFEVTPIEKGLATCIGVLAKAGSIQVSFSRSPT